MSVSAPAPVLDQTSAASPMATQALLDNDIFAALGATDISDFEKGSILVRMLELLQLRAFDRIIEQLNPQQLEDFTTRVADSGDDDVMQAFIEEHVPNLPQIYQDEALKMRADLVKSLAVTA